MGVTPSSELGQYDQGADWPSQSGENGSGMVMVSLADGEKNRRGAG
jgi:hypothetical protein